jgi:hypothetical protein
MNVKQICRQVQSWLQEEEGMLLLDVQLCLLFLIILGGIFYQAYLIGIKTGASLEQDVGLYQAHRYTQQLLLKELSLNARTVTIGGLPFSPRIIVRHQRGGVCDTYYLNGEILYRKRETTHTKGINPYSASGFAIRELTWSKLSSRALLLKWRLEEEKSGRSKEFEQVFVLGNGTVL